MPGIVIQITGDGAGAEAALRIIEERMKETAKKGSEMSERLAEAGERIKSAFEMVGVGLGIREAVDGFKEMLEKSMELGVEIGHLSKQTGISAENLSTLKYVSDQTGVSFEVMSKGFKKLSTDLYEMQGGAKAPAKAFADLGISQKQLAATGGDLMKVTQLIADAMEKMPDGFEKNAIATELFGKAGTQLIAVLDQGGAAFEKYSGEARALGVVLDDAGIEKLEKMHQASNQLKESMAGLGLEITSFLSPAIQQLDAYFTNFIEASKVSLSGSGQQALIDTITNYLTHREEMKNEAQNPKWWQAAGMSSAPSGGFQPGDPEGDKNSKDNADKLAMSEGELGQKLLEETDRWTKEQIQKYDQLGEARLKLDEAYSASSLTLIRSSAASENAALEAGLQAGNMSEIDFLERRLRVLQAESDQEVAVLQEKAAALKAAGASGGTDATAKQLELQSQLVAVNTKLAALSEERAKAEADTAAQINAQVASQKQQQAKDQQDQYQKMIQVGLNSENQSDSVKTQTANQAGKTIGGFLEQTSQAALRGKANFKEMVDSAISDLDRFAIKILEERTLIPALNQLFGIGSGGAYAGLGAGPMAQTTPDSISDLIPETPMDAGGGDIGAGGMAIVGDGGDGSGSELFAPSGPGTVLPHDVLEGIAKGGGSRGGAPNVTLNNINNSSANVSMKQTGVSWDSDARQFVINTMLEDMQQGGPTSQAMRGLGASGG